HRIGARRLPPRQPPRRRSGGARCRRRLAAPAGRPCAGGHAGGAGRAGQFAARALRARSRRLCPGAPAPGRRQRRAHPPDGRAVSAAALSPLPGQAGCGTASAAGAGAMARGAVGAGLPANGACSNPAFAGKPASTTPAPTVPGLLPLLRLLQLASPALPVGAYTYSQGLEWAVESGAVRNEADAAGWMGELLEWSLARIEVPLLAGELEAWAEGDDGEVARLNADFLASRETAELRAETVQMGWSLVKLLAELEAFAALPGWRARLLAI